MIGEIVTVTVDRAMGTYHPEHKDMYYPINYGYIEGMKSYCSNTSKWWYWGKVGRCSWEYDFFKRWNNGRSFLPRALFWFKSDDVA